MQKSARNPRLRVQNASCPKKLFIDEEIQNQNYSRFFNLFFIFFIFLFNSSMVIIKHKHNTIMIYFRHYNQQNQQLRQPGLHLYKIDWCCPQRATKTTPGWSWSSQTSYCRSQKWEGQTTAYPPHNSCIVGVPLIRKQGGKALVKNCCFSSHSPSGWEN